MYTSRSKGRTATSVGSLAIALLMAGCFVQSPTGTQLPAEFQSLQATREAIAINPDDPLLDVPAGTVTDDLAGLDGCWAAYQRVLSEEQTPILDIGDPLLDDYDFFRIDATTGEMVYQAYGASLLPAFAFSTYVTYHGTYRIEGNNRLIFDYDSFTFVDPLNGETQTYPEDMDSGIADYDEALAEFEAASVWTYLVTLDGDHLKLVQVYTDEETGAESLDEADSVLVLNRIACP